MSPRFPLNKVMMSTQVRRLSQRRAVSEGKTRYRPPDSVSRRASDTEQQDTERRMIRLTCSRDMPIESLQTKPLDMKRVKRARGQYSGGSQWCFSQMVYALITKVLNSVSNRTSVTQACSHYQWLQKSTWVLALFDTAVSMFLK